MATAAALIKQAMQDLGVLGAGRTPTTGDYTDCLEKLNDMLDSWSTSSLLVPFRTQVSKTLTGAQSYTIGVGGDINTARPTYIESAHVSDSGNDYPVNVLRDRAAYDRIAQKNLTGIPGSIYYEPSLPLGNLFVWYVGDSGNVLYLNVRGELTRFPDTTTDIDLSQGYKKAVYSNLALEIAPMYEVSASQELFKKATEGMAMIKRLNRQVPVMQYDEAIPGVSGRYNIETG